MNSSNFIIRYSMFLVRYSRGRKLHHSIFDVPCSIFSGVANFIIRHSMFLVRYSQGLQTSSFDIRCCLFDIHIAAQFLARNIEAIAKRRTVKFIIDACSRSNLPITLRYGTKLTQFIPSQAEIASAYTQRLSN